MSDNILSNRKLIRQRPDATALHKSEELDAVSVTDIVRLDIVAQKLSIDLDGLTANVSGSLNGVDFVQIGAGVSGQFTHGDVVGDMLVKWVKIDRTAGSGSAVILGA